MLQLYGFGLADMRDAPTGHDRLRLVTEGGAQEQGDHVSAASSHRHSRSW